MQFVMTSCNAGSCATSTPAGPSFDFADPTITPSSLRLFGSSSFPSSELFVPSTGASFKVSFDGSNFFYHASLHVSYGQCASNSHFADSRCASRRNRARERS